MIPRAFIDDLLARVDIVSVIEHYVPLKKSGINYFGCCPFHGEKTASFSVSPSKQFYHCFGCGAHGTAINFLMEYSSLSFVEAVTDLARQQGLQVPHERGNRDNAQRAPRHTGLLERMQRAADFYRAQLDRHPAAREYARRRGLSDAIIERFGIGYAPPERHALRQVFADYESPELVEAGLVIVPEEASKPRYDRFRGRLMFPIADRRGRIIAFGGRILDQGEPKYLNSPETPLFEKGRELYGLALAQKGARAQGYVLVVEGYMDVVSLAQFGIENAVATLGTATSEHHIQTLARLSNRIVFAFDGDQAGRRAARRALEAGLEKLRDDLTLAFLFLPPEHDPDSYVREYGKAALEEAARNARPLTEYLLEDLSRELDLNTAEGRARLAHSAQPLVARIRSAPILRLQLIKAFAQASGLSVTEIERAWQLAPAGAPAPAAAKPRRSSLRARATPHHRQPPKTPVHLLLRLVLQRPILAARIPIGIISAATPEGAALIAIIDMVEMGDIHHESTLAQLAVHFRHTPHATVFDSLSADLLQNEDIDEATAETLFEDTIRRLGERALRDEINALTERARTTKLSPEEQQHLLRLLKRKNDAATSN